MGLAFVVFSIGSMGKILPVQAGGMGAYHLFVTNLLIIYGVDQLTGLSLATMLHGIQVLFYLIMGGICLLIYFLAKKKN